MFLWFVGVLVWQSFMFSFLAIVIPFVFEISMPDPKSVHTSITFRFKKLLAKRLASFWSFYWWLWTYLTPCSSVSIVNFEQVNADWVEIAAKYCTIWLIPYSKTPNSLFIEYRNILRENTILIFVIPHKPILEYFLKTHLNPTSYHNP